MSIQIKINGESRDVPDGSTITTLLAAANLRPTNVAIELNRRLLRAANYDTPLKPADEVEIVTFVGGG